MFGDMTRAIKEDTVRILYHIQVEQKVEREQQAQVTGTNRDDTLAQAPKKRSIRKIYPNDPCPCGSGKKYKQCHGRDEYQKMMNQKVSEAQAEKAQDEMLDNAGKN